MDPCDWERVDGHRRNHRCGGGAQGADMSSRGDAHDDSLSDDTWPRGCGERLDCGAREDCGDPSARQQPGPTARRDDTRTDFIDVAVMQASARVGTIVGKKWHLDALLGAGGMAAVYSATHRNGSRAALKILHVTLAADRAVRHRFQREGYAANAVAHPGAVRVLDDDVLEDGSPFLVTELLDGETLEDRRERLGGRLSIPEVLTYMDALLDVLVAAHSNGVIHRDIKPDNLFLTRGGQLKVLDFGIARLRDLTSESQLTKTGALLGTPRFMPPEQARGLTDEVDAQSDLWACGATMFDLLSGRPVFDAQTPHQVLMLAATVPAPPFRSVLPHAAPTLASVIDRALAFEKKDRWPSALAMQQAVRAAYCHRRGADPSPARGEGPSHASAWRRERPATLDADLERSWGLRGKPSEVIPPRRAAQRQLARTRHPLVPEGIPSLRSTMSDGISDQTLTPTNPQRDRRATDRPVVATVPKPAPAQRIQIALPAFMLGAGLAAAVALTVRLGPTRARVDLSPLVAPPPAAADVRSAETPATQEMRAGTLPEPEANDEIRRAARVESPGVSGAAPIQSPRVAMDPSPLARSARSGTVRAPPAPPASDARTAIAAQANAPATLPPVPGDAGHSVSPVPGPWVPPERTGLRRNCMRLDDPGIDGGNVSRVVCL